jgi:hypothetical protein
VTQVVVMYLGVLVDVDMAYQGATALDDCPHHSYPIPTQSRMIRQQRPQAQWPEATFVN